jgi:hypothetical protein
MLVLLDLSVVKLEEGGNDADEGGFESGKLAGLGASKTACPNPC